jgi:hypothetical protein
MKGDFSRWTFDEGKHYHGVLKQQGRVDVDADWNEQNAIASHRVETETLDVVGPSGAPVGNAGFQVSPVPGGKDLMISAGRAYVDGILCENEQALKIDAQPDYPGFQLPTAPDIYIAWLRVWERHIIALDDPHIREVALGGPDTCTRAKTVWQVGLLQPTVTGAITCSTSLPAWDALTAASTGTLAARAQPDPTATDPCMIPAKAGYRSLENQLYRVEIHAGGSNGQATFKWSRENGSVVTAWTGESGNDLAVTSTGRDAVLGFAAGQWIELTDDTHDLNFQPGTLVQITAVQNNTITIDPGTAAGPVAFASFPTNPRVRRWDSAGALPAKAGSWINLENGVQVEFSTGSYNTGDYWMIPARTLTADVDWPLDTGGNPLAVLPRGIRRHYCRLTVLAFNGSVWTVTSNCLPMFPPLSTLNPTTTEPGIHISAVRTLQHNLNLLNDSNVPLALLSEGIGVVCDAPVAPHSISRATCFVTVEIPYPPATANLTTGANLALNPTANLSLATPAQIAGATAPAGAGSAAPATGAGLQINPNAAPAVGPILGFQPLILFAATGVSTDSQTIQWNLANPGILTYLQGILTVLQSENQDARLLTHLTVKGNFIWGPNDRLVQMYLDGDAYGTPRQDNPNDATSIHTSIAFKTGNGQRGGDFQMWFWLSLPVTLVSLTFTPATVTTVGQSVGTLTLSAPAPAGGVVVTLTPNNAQLATVPATATIAAGQTTGTFQVTNASSTSAVSQLQITATYGQSSVNGVLLIQGPPPK